MPLGVPGAGVDADGKVLGFEFSSFAEYAEMVERAGGSLEVPDRLRALTTSDSGQDPEILRDAISSLEPQGRDLLQLLIRDGLNIRDAAERLEISLAVAFRLRSVALENLRAKLYGSTTTSGTDRSIEVALSKLLG